MAFHTQGAPTVIPSNQVGVGMVQGDQLGDQLPGVLASLQESPEASKTSSLYYQDVVGKFTQPSFQRACGDKNLPLNTTRFGDGASIEVNPDIYWRGPMLVRTTFTIPYAYYGPNAFRPAGVPGLVSSTSATPAEYVPQGFDGVHQHYLHWASSYTSRPRMFYSWGAAYANFREIRMNMGGAMNYVLDHYSNWVAIMASCPEIIQRVALMRAAGNGTMNPDFESESKMGLSHDNAEIGMILQYGADGGATSSANSNATANGNGTSAGTSQTGASALPGPIIEHWVMAIKTPHTSYYSTQQYRRPIDTRLFSSNFVFDFFTSPSLDSFVDSGTGYQPLAPWMPTSASSLPASSMTGLLVPANWNAKVWGPLDGIFPSMLYRQLQIPNYSVVSAALPTYDASFCLINSDVSAVSGSSAVAMNTFSNYRAASYTNYGFIANSPGYAQTYGPNPGTQSSTNYFNPANSNTFPTPLYSTIISSSRLSNDQLGAKQILETRADLCVYYPFMHFTSQIYRVNQITSSTGVIPYSSSGVYTPQTPYVNSVAGGQGYGAITEQNMKNFTSSPYSYQNPLNVALSIPNNPMTVLYIAVMREKDRIGLGYSTPNQYSPVLYWNCLELQAFSLKYSAQILQKYDNLDEYFLTQLQERVHPLVIPFRGGPVCRSDLPLNRPDLVLNAPGYPGAWYNSYVYELPMVDQLPIRNEAFFQQTPSFRGEMLSFDFWIKPSLRPYRPCDFDFRSATGPDTAISSYTVAAADWAAFVEKVAAWAPGIPQSAVLDSPGINWNLNNDNLMVVCVFAQNALWQLSPLHCKMIFARGA